MAKIIDENGFWLIKSNPITKEGVFPYLGRTISPQLEPDKIYSVYRSFDELSAPETLKSFDGVPFINDHEMLGKGFTPYDQRQAAGVLMNPAADNGVVRGDLKIFSESLKDAISGGKKELSLGYKCDYVLRNGEWNGQHYDAVQKNIRGNHIALVDKGRMGADVRVYDGFTFDALDFDNENSPEPENKGKEIKMPGEQDPKTTNPKETKDEHIDKRKLIDEVGGMLKDKVDEEVWRTIVGKLEKLAYNDSESGKTTDGEDPDPETKPDNKEKTGKDADPAEGKEKENKGKGEDKCGKDEFYDVPKVEKLIDQLEAAGKLNASALREGLKSTLYQRRGDGTDSAADIIREVDARNALVKDLEPLIGQFACDGMTRAEVAAYACGKLGLDNSDPIPTVNGYIAAAKKSRTTYTLDKAENAKSANGLSANLSEYLK